MTSAAPRERVFSRIQIATPFALFLLLAGRGLTGFFTGDDVMNLFTYLQRPASWWLPALAKFWSSEGYRPLGGVVYVTLYKAFGFHPAPFKVFLCVLLFLNLALCWRVSTKLSQSRQIALWTILFCSYHAAFDGLWLNFGTIFDVLGYSCFFGALLAYVEGRRGAAVVLLYLAGLEFKEIVVTLPAVLLLWSLLFKPALRKWPVLLCFVIAAIYTAGKLRGPESLITNPAYTPHFTLQQFATVTAHYIRQVFYLPPRSPAPVWAVSVMALMILAGALLRSRLMIFCALSIVITQLPVSFIAPRGGFAIYIPWTFWGIYAAAVVERITQPFDNPRRAFVLWALAAAALVVVHVRMKPRFDPLYTVPSAGYQALSKNLDAWHVHVSKNARVLLVNDPFPSYWIPWDPMWLINLRDHTTEAVVNRLKLDTYVPPDAEMSAYDYVIDYDAAWLLLKRPGMPLLASEHLRELHAKAQVLLCDGFRFPIQGLWRETAPLFTIETRAADGRPHELALSLVSYTAARLTVQVDDGPVQSLGVRPVPNIDLKVPVPAGAHTVTFRSASAHPNGPAHVFFVDARLLTEPRP